jgi:hypothetical protein
VIPTVGAVESKMIRPNAAKETSMVHGQQTPNYGQPFFSSFFIYLCLGKSRSSQDCIVYNLASCKKLRNENARDDDCQGKCMLT